MVRAFILLLVCAQAAGFSACNAFADAAGADAGGSHGDPTLKIEPSAFIKQGQTKAFTITFLVDPPWIDTPNPSKTSLTHFDPGPEIGWKKVEYGGLGTIEATLFAELDAAVGVRRLEVTVAFEREGKPQLTHSGWGRYWVGDSQGMGSADGGSDAGGGGE